MKKTVFIGMGFLLMFGACEMPGTGEIASQVQGQVDDISDEIQDVVENNEELSGRIDDLQEQLSSGTFEMPDMPDFDLDGIMETFDEDFQNLSARSDSLIDEMALVIETQSLSIDSLRAELNGLEGEIASLRNRVNNLGANSGDSGRSGSTSGGSTGRSGSTSGGSTGGTSGRS
ncbi:MAG: hypothetical protein KAS73_13965 [Candidatus Sabulitectum sp.]|nr:hypothetical protein [Candidatus Sabulitectum sp.]